MKTPLTLVHLESLSSPIQNDDQYAQLAVKDFTSDSLNQLKIDSEWIAFLPEIKGDLSSVSFDSLIPKDAKSAMIPVHKTDGIPEELGILPVNIAVLVADPLFMGIPVLHQSLFEEAITAPSFSPIHEVFVNQSLQQNPIETPSFIEGIEIVSGQTLPELGPGHPESNLEWLRFKLLNNTIGKLISQSDTSLETTALRAGLLLFLDELDISHRCSQSREGDQLADHWHGIMHRREPDDSNSKYWYRRVGHSPIFGELAGYADQVFSTSDVPEAENWRGKLVSGSDWDSFAFVEFCSSCRRSRESELTEFAEKIQYMEMLLLLRESC